ncbi:TlpA family protein disulfide reductase [Polaribacter sp. Z014]|uniref:TlpA family protein disulfide reductase n=1 Tax=unclassified Polaribacter TaxID=196858 RepID=UPI00193AFC13|nr:MULTISPECIES: TlpA disulfide reductase family protein [unclassified Polaribacter]MCL7762127.1 TlpA family protein disulfide reductase [Polaribacter sp. Z014]QVY64444.1 TlpA family protein disulfide reductase [Polaribacter sp. Q13]
MLKNILFSCTLFISLSVLSQQNFKLKDTAPNFKLWLIDGSKLTNEDTKGKVVVLKFWFTSCMPCLTDIPTLNSLVKEFEKRDDILFIAPALDRKPVIEKLLEVHPFHFKIAYSAMDVSRKFNKQQVYPSYFIINKKGEITYIDSGSKKSDVKNLREAIIKSLK